MAANKSIKVHHLTRVEGHGDLVVEIRDGALEEVRFPIVEAPRFFEAFLRGYHYEEVAHMASRICGICAVAHRCAALKATEAALGVEISLQTELLRRLAFHGEILSSHILHIYFLAGPDFLGVPSVFPLKEINPEILHRAIRLKRLGYDLCRAVAGRHTHPVGMKVGGFSFVQAEAELAAMRERLAESADDFEATVKLLRGINLPEFERETEYVCLKHPDHYAFYDGVVHSSKGNSMMVENYRQAIEEYLVPHSTAKHACWHGSRYMVGALARLNINFDQLMPRAKQTAEDLSLSAPCFNPFFITLAQVVECVHCVEESIELIDRLMEQTITGEQIQVEPQAGIGVGAVEAPRGTLFHEYEYDAKGRCLAANHVIPTAQNLANIEEDMRAFVPEIAGEDDDTIRLKLEMLVRAYDPCISCATHMITLDRR
ncbi:MAG: Ni/Fe hydrogenase subunit alpha [Syntrophobacteria bacterium]